jgi:hypothetical protein
MATAKDYEAGRASEGYRERMGAAVAAGVIGRVGHRDNDQYRRAQGDIITPALITYVQRWLRVRFGIETSLFIERDPEQGRNRVILRLNADGCIQEGEVARLNALRKRNPLAPMDRVLLLFERTA